jgi:hypothetical protein
MRAFRIEQNKCAQRIPNCTIPLINHSPNNLGELSLSFLSPLTLDNLESIFQLVQKNDYDLQIARAEEALYND